MLSQLQDGKTKNIQEGIMRGTAVAYISRTGWQAHSQFAGISFNEAS